MSETEEVTAPVEFVVGDDGKVSLTFGPMPMEDLVDVVVSLTTEEGKHGFLRGLEAALRKEVGRER